jgi:hypothetical protein
LPPRSSLYDYFDLWSWDGTLNPIHDALMSNVAKEQSARLPRRPRSSTARA